jgi:hypothetical protein
MLDSIKSIVSTSIFGMIFSTFFLSVGELTIFFFFASSKTSINIKRSQALMKGLGDF